MADPTPTVPEPLTALVVDDEPLARGTLLGLLAGDPEIRVVGACGTGAEAVARIEAVGPDIVFLDVQMPEVDGFELLRRVPAERLGVVVFVTAWESYALRAFAAEALDYLLKPFDDERFRLTLARAKARVRERRAHRLARELLAALGAGAVPIPPEPSAYVERLAIKADGKVSLLAVDEVDWIEAADYCVRIHAAGRVHLLREPMKDLERRLDPRRFFRVHRSAIVNLARVRELHPYFRGESIVALADGTRLRLSRARRERLHALLGVPA
jgi:two-component system, LytTR family, response regulator